MPRRIMASALALTVLPGMLAFAQRVPPKPGLVTSSQHRTPDDLGYMRTYEAEALGGVTPAHVVPDRAPVKWVAFHYETTPREVTFEDVTVVRARPLDPVLRVTLEDLDIGMYEMRLFGRVDRPDEEIPQYREPLFIELRVNDGPNGEVNRYRMRCPYDSMHRDLARISFHAFRKGSYEAEILVGEGTYEGLLPVLLDRIELHNRMHGVAFRRGKTRHYLVGDEELASGVQRKGVAGVRNPDTTPLAEEDMARIFAEEWTRLPPINRQYAGQAQQYKLLDPPAGAVSVDKLGQIGVWEVEGNDLINRTLELRYTWQDYLDYKPLPDPYPFKDAGTGYWFDPATHPEITESRRYIYIIPALFERPIVSGHGGRGVDYVHPSDVLAAFYSQDSALNFRLASWLIAAALRAPAQQSKTLDLFHYHVIPNAPWPADWRWIQDRRGGYSALSLARCYDYLYPAIQKNEGALVRLVQPHIPWIRTPEDLYTFLDAYILQYGVEAMKTEIASPASNTAQHVPEMAIIQGPNEISAPWLDFSTYPVLMYPSPHTVPRTDSLLTMMNRDGTTYIASWRVYAFGNAKSIFNTIESTEDYRAMGGEIRTDFTDSVRWPKAAAAAKLLLDAQVAGGYPLPIGDASGTLVEGRVPEWGVDESFARYGWQMHKDWRFAWYLANKFGDTRPEILAAAEGRRHPEMSQVSRVLHGFGAGILESGTESDDFRFKRAAILRVGTGIGHAHSDQLDLNFFAHGLRMAVDLACRSEGNKLRTLPQSWLPIVHNLVSINDMRRHIWLGATANGDAWLEEFKPFVGAQYMSGSAALNAPRDTAKVYHRQVALVDIDDGDAESDPVQTPNSYIFDVFRVHGGKLHTWNFHGPQADEFVANVALNPVGDNTFSIPDEGEFALPAEQRSALFLRRHLAGSRYDGTAADEFVGTWRMSRPGSTMALHTGETIDIPGGEQVIGTHFDPDSPRKYTRITLFGHAGAHVMVGNVHGYGMNTPLLHVQSKDEIPERSEVYPAIIEAFVGESVIAGKRLLPVAPNEDDALRAVAIAVDTINGHRDINVADGRPERERVVDGTLTVSGRYAHVSRDAAGVRLAHLVGGAKLHAADIRIDAGQREHSGRILEVDYLKRRMVVDNALPEKLLDGQQMHILNDDHRCTFQLARVTTDENGRTIVEWEGDATMLQSRVDKIDAENGEVWVQMRPPVAEFPNRRRGWTASNEANTMFWKAELNEIEWDGDDRAMPGIYRLTGQPVRAADFTDADNDGRTVLRLYDFGPGDSFQLPTHVQFKRLSTGMFEISADTPCAVSLPAAAVQGRQVHISADGHAWRTVVQASARDGFVAVALDAAALADGKVYLRIQ